MPWLGDTPSDDRAGPQTCFYSDGFPFFAHLVGLYASRAAIRAKTQEVTGNDLNAALTEAAKSVTANYKRLRQAHEVGVTYSREESSRGFAPRAPNESELVRCPNIMGG
jgi:hypothetical protein